jgi:hypothetical protein
VQQMRMRRRPAPTRPDEATAPGRTAKASDTTSADAVLAQIEAALAEA